MSALALALGLAFAGQFLADGTNGPARHPSHVTIAQAEFNAESASLEVALRIDPFDLEKALTAVAGEPVNLDQTENVDELVVDYLNEAFVLQFDEADPIELNWVGKEVFVHTAWLYFEFTLPDGPDGAQLTNRLLFELQDDQVNTVNYRRGASLKTLHHTLEEPRQRLSAKPG